MIKTYKELIIKNGMEITAEFRKQDNSIFIGWYFTTDIDNKPVEINENSLVTVVRFELEDLDEERLSEYIEGDFKDLEELEEVSQVVWDNYDDLEYIEDEKEIFELYKYANNLN